MKVNHEHMALEPLACTPIPHQTFLMEEVNGRPAAKVIGYVPGKKLIQHCISITYCIYS